MLKDQCYAAWNSDPGRATTAAAALAALAEAAAHPEVDALAAWGAGIAALAEGRMEAATESLDLAAARFSRLGQHLAAAHTQVPRLIALAMLGHYEEANACGRAARDALLAYGDPVAAGRIDLNLGNIAFRRDHYRDAERHYRAAYDLLTGSDDPGLLVVLENGLADVLARRLQFSDAHQLYERALRRAEAANLEMLQAAVECNLGNLALSQGRYDEALAYLERSRRRYAALEMPHESAYADLELAEAYLELNLTPEAAAIFARVIPLFADLGMRAEQAWALAHHGQTHVRLGDRDAARQQFAEARQLFAEEGNAVSAAMVALFEAQLHYTEQQYGLASATAAQARSVFHAAGGRGYRLLAGWLQGEATRAAGDLASARPVLEQVLSEAAATAAPQITQRCATSLGMIAVAQGDLIAAERLLTRAVAVIEQLRAPLPAEEFRSAFFSDKLSPFAALVRICLATGRTAEALAYVEQARSRTLVELLSGSARQAHRPLDAFEAEQLARLGALRQELNWCYQRISRALSAESYNPTMVEALQADAQEREVAILELTRQIQQHGSTDLVAEAPFDLAGLQAQLDPETVVVAYASLDETVIAFVITDTAVRVVGDLAAEPAIDTLVDQLRFQTDAMRRAVGRRAGHQQQLLQRARHYLGRLYDALLRPLADLVGDRRLVVVPHRSLHYVPFRALFDGDQYVIERQEVCTVPSAAVLQHCLRHTSRGQTQALFVGVPDALAPRVRDEILAVAPLFSDRVTLLDAQATLAGLRRHAPQAHILHLACHGQFRADSPLFSSLRLADGWLTVRDAYGLDLACDLVVLSACETGVSAIAPGDELMGLARGFFAAGAPSLVVSLWTVDDATTAELMHTFYTRLCAGDRPSAALRHAQRTLMRTHPHPFYWAPFVLMGRW